MTELLTNLPTNGIPYVSAPTAVPLPIASLPSSKELPKFDPRKPRPVLKEGESLCDYCSAKCCKYFAWPIERPSERPDFDYIRWAMLHTQTTFFVEDDDWYVLVHTTCKHLMADNRCGIYETRPEICRSYSTNDCEFDDHYVYEKYFETPEQVHEYMEVVAPDPKRTSIRSRKPALLPIL